MKKSNSESSGLYKLKCFLKKTGFIFKETFIAFMDDNVMKLSAALSYYTIFSLPPLLIIIINLSGFFFGEEAVRGELFGQINGLVGNEAALQIQTAIKNVKLSDGGTFAMILSVTILVIGASGVFAEIQNSINYIWGIKAKPNKGLIKFVKNRLMSFSMIGTVGFLLMVGLIVNSVIELLSKKLSTYFSNDFVSVFLVLNNLVVYLIIVVLFTFVFKTLPDGRVSLKDCIVGSLFTSILFILGKFAIGFYLGSSAVANIYGAAGSVIMILIWVYYSAIILYFGAEFTKVYATTHGNGIVPNEYTVKFIQNDVELKPADPEFLESNKEE